MDDSRVILTVAIAVLDDLDRAVGYPSSAVQHYRKVSDVLVRPVVDGRGLRHRRRRVFRYLICEALDLRRNDRFLLYVLPESRTERTNIGERRECEPRADRGDIFHRRLESDFRDIDFRILPQ